MALKITKSEWGWYLLIILVYWVMAKICHLTFTANGIPSPVWPPAGIALAATLILGNRALPLIAIAAFISNYHTTDLFIFNTALLNALAPAIATPLQAWVGAKLLMTMAKTTDPFASVKAGVVFVLFSAFAACLINTTISITTLYATGIIPAAGVLYSAITWWTGDAIGVVTIGATIMAWNRPLEAKLSWQQTLELITVWVLLLMVSYLSFTSEKPLLYTLIPFALWVCFRFGPRAATLTSLLISGITIYEANMGYGEFKYIHSVTDSLIIVQTFVGIVFLTVLLIKSILLELKKNQTSLQKINTQLNTIVEERTADLLTKNNQLIQRSQELEAEKNTAIKALSDLKLAETQLIHAEKMASLGVLTAGVAHEINNPLNFINANIGSIKVNVEEIMLLINCFDKATNLEEFQKQYNNFKALKETINIGVITNENNVLFKGIEEGLKRVIDIVRDLKMFSRAGEEMKQKQSYDLNANIDAALNLLKTSIRKGIVIVRKYDKLPSIMGYPSKFSQAILNLVMNAAQAIPDDRDGEIIIKTQKRDNIVLVSVKDNGIGISQETLKNIFMPFFTTKEIGEGMGLGLSITYNIIKEHGGNIEVISKEGEGTEFLISLPIGVIQ